MKVNGSSIFMTLLFSFLACEGGVSATFTETDHGLEIFASSPPALMFVQNDQGNLSGADPSAPMTTYGRGNSIQEIPNSFVDVDNLVSDDPASLGDPNHTTGWSVNILDEAAGTYRTFRTSPAAVSRLSGRLTSAPVIVCRRCGTPPIG